MTFIAVPNIPKLHETPLAMVQVKDSQVRVELDDDQEKRFVLTFKPYQAMRITTADCYRLPEGITLSSFPRPHQRAFSRVVIEVVESPWISELTKALKQIDETATFMTKAKHFIVPLQDDFLEVVAWGIGASDSNKSAE